MKRLLALAALALALPSAPAAIADEALLAEACGECHGPVEGGLSRIAGQRKTPEGWLMTIVRMRVAHGVTIAPADQSKLVHYLSATQGLAPSETKGWRYALEKDPSYIEAIDEPLGSMCSRCHTGARVMLQRRTAEEWLLHMDFHVGQYPTTEYQALGRDREWLRIAREEVAPLLAETLPFETEAWAEWQAAGKPDATGDWIVLTDLPKKGPAYGRLTIEGEGSPYRVKGQFRLADGSGQTVSGSMNLYTGYEWRANLKIGDTTYRQVLAISEDGTRLEGRQFVRDADSLGAPLSGVKADAGPVILGTVPQAAKPGDVELQIVGVGLDGAAVAGATAADLKANDYGASARVSARENAALTVTAGEASAAAAVWKTVDRITVEPPFTIARVGGGSDSGPDAVPAHFRAIGWWNGPDGAPETDDDVRVGQVPAKWSVENEGEIAEQMRDAKFAGKIDPASGIFSPAVAGPNPARPFSTNNAGDLKIVAEAAGKKAEARLIVTVQRFIDPPIR